MKGESNIHRFRVASDAELKAPALTMMIKWYFDVACFLISASRCAPADRSVLEYVVRYHSHNVVVRVPVTRRDQLDIGILHKRA